MMQAKILYIVVFIASINHINGQSNTSTTISSNNFSQSMTEEALLNPVKALIKAMDFNDAELIKKQFAKTATQGTMKTPQATALWLETDIIDRQGKVKNPVFTILNHNQVNVKGQYSSRGYTSKANFIFTVENGLITSWRMYY